ncbi:MAG: NAD(P)H-dependent oxidoreductase subunit E [Thermoguttaceae bacterium]
MEIVICMGSSCFTRGNEENLRVIEEFIALNDCEDQVQLSGKCCLGRCSDGPNIVIDGQCFNRVNKEMLIDLLNERYVGAGQ